ncbi:MAG: MiaB/RimO family radical SAM methylthiotransferase [Elusimicrobia bacterium]|nr:MiaB/RimO family radical SAM methylthiotransferase [Elusimicrobiota bacterium]
MKVYFKTIGCRVNQVETQSLLEKFAALGHSATSDLVSADLVLINSCSVTEYADRDAVKFLKKIAGSNPKARIAVTGCLATLDPKKILSIAPAALIFNNTDKEKIPFELCGAPFKPDAFAVSRFEGRTRAFVKLQDGCNLVCSYCLVPKARSSISSKPALAAENEIKNLIMAGFKEIVLCGTRLGMYNCPETGLDLGGLMERLLALPGEFRLRFSSLEPMEISEGLMTILARGGKKFCPYFHLPLQSGSDKVLKEMRRPYDTASYLCKVGFIRAVFPCAGLYTDVITGYPSETLQDFDDTLAFIKRCEFSGLHIFSYSSRPGTAAASLKPLSPQIVKARSAALHELDAELRAVFAASMIGGELEVLILKNQADPALLAREAELNPPADIFHTGSFPQKGGASRSLGLADNFLNISVEGRLEPGGLYNVKITGAESGCCLGEVVGAGSRNQ